MLNRRQLIGKTAAFTGLATVLNRTISGAQTSEPAANNPAPVNSSVPKTPGSQVPSLPPGEPGKHYTPTVTLNGSTLPFKIVNGVKVMHLTAEEVWHEFVPKTASNDALKARCWGFNGQVHGPTIECVEGDHLRIYVTNKLPEATAIHWHGLILPNGMDGVAGLTQKAIQPGETFVYEFTTCQSGTFMYHAHHDEMTQMALGLMGMFVIHPREDSEPRPDRDFVYLLSEWRIDPGTTRPNPNEMTEFNVLTLNAKAFPGTAPMIVKQGDRTRIRIGNLSAMDHHSMHFHGHVWSVIETEGGRVPASARVPEVTTLVPVGSTRTVEFIANNPGDWAFHCHMTHHVMNQMGHQIPNLMGIDPGDFDKRIRKFLPGYMTMGENGMGDMGDMGMKVPRNSVPMVGAPGPYDYVTMGGMYTNIKVRPNLESYEKDPGWYEQPPGTSALLASHEQLQRDLGFIPGDQPTKTSPASHNHTH